MSADADDRTIADIRLITVNVSTKTNWSFLELTLDDGATGLGEATLHGYEPLLAGYLEICRPQLLGQTVAAMAGALDPGRARPVGLAAHAIISALEQARFDLAAARAGVPLSVWLGAPAPVTVPLYANINRSLDDRTPDSFAAQAARAVAEGFTAIKIAPFDAVRPDAGDGAANEAAVRRGLDRIAAVRSAIGRGPLLMVDCHWRFSAGRARALVDELGLSSVGWVECPLPETPAHFAALAGLRQRANGQGARLAGAETQIGLEGSLPFLDLYDVVMPDLKYCGGPAQMLAIADAACARGVSVAPHNPSGPVCHAASVQMAAHPAIDLLELQYRESPLFDRLVTGAPPVTADGVSKAGAAPGLGVTLDRSVCSAHPGRPVPPPR